MNLLETIGRAFGGGSRLEIDSSHTVDDFQKAAIIGWYRQGASWQEIAALADIPAWQAEKIVNDYLKTIDKP